MFGGKNSLGGKGVSGLGRKNSGGKGYGGKKIFQSQEEKELGGKRA